MTWWSSPDDAAAAIKVAISNREHLRSKRESRATLREWLIHTASVSYPCRPPTIAEKWALLEQEELHAQGDREFKQKIPFSSPFNDRQRLVIHHCKLLISVIDYLARPMVLVGVDTGLFPELLSLVHYARDTKLHAEMALGQTEEWRHQNQAEISARAVQKALQTARETWAREDAVLEAAIDPKGTEPAWVAKAKILGGRGGLLSGDSGRRGIRSAWSLWEDEQDAGENRAKLEPTVTKDKSA